MGHFKLTDSDGKPISLRTKSLSVEMQNGKTLADYEPVHPLATIRHDLDAYPYVMLLLIQRDESAVMIPVGVEYISRSELIVYTAQVWGEPFILRKIKSQEYSVAFENAGEVVYIRLI